jgi:hypothetical protein
VKKIVLVGGCAAFALAVMSQYQVVTTNSGLAVATSGQVFAADLPPPPPHVGKGKAPIGKGKMPVPVLTKG